MRILVYLALITTAFVGLSTAAQADPTTAQAGIGPNGCDGQANIYANAAIWPSPLPANADACISTTDPTQSVVCVSAADPVGTNGLNCPFQ